MFNSQTSGLGGRVVRRFAPLATAIAVLGAIGGGTATNAGAGVASWNCVAPAYGSCMNPTANLSVNSATPVIRGNLKTLRITAGAGATYGRSVAMRFYSNSGFPGEGKSMHLPSNGGTVTVVNYASAWVALQPYTVRLWAEFAIWDGTKWTGYQKVWAVHQYTIDSEQVPVLLQVVRLR